MNADQNRKMIKDFRLALKDMEPMVKDPEHLRRGRDISNFSLRPREAWANWLLCAVLRHIHGDWITFAEDEESDGLLVNMQTGDITPVEQVSVLDVPSKSPLPSVEWRIIQAILKKAEYGEGYASGKCLIVFFEGVGLFTRQVIREAVRGKHFFAGLYTIGLLQSGEDGYQYWVTQYHDDRSVTFVVHIPYAFESWTVEQLIE